MSNIFKRCWNDFKLKIYFYKVTHRPAFSYVIDIYKNYRYILDIRSKYDGNELLHNTRYILKWRYIEERMNFINDILGYKNEHDIYDDIFFDKINVKSVKNILRYRDKEWIKLLYDDIMMYEYELIVELNISSDDFEE